MWPASALLTGNGIAFILRVPGTEHGDWWSMNGWWIYAGTAAVAIRSKHLIRFRGRHVLQPVERRARAHVPAARPRAGRPARALVGADDAVDGRSPSAIIVVGGFAILRRLRLLEIAATFWVMFAARDRACSPLAGHEMTARWHLGPITRVRVLEGRSSSRRRS